MVNEGYMNKDVYGVTDEEIKMAREAYEKRNTNDGVIIYLRLEKVITDRNGDNTILYDLAADFDWDIDWDKAVAKKLVELAIEAECTIDGIAIDGIPEDVLDRARDMAYDMYMQEIEVLYNKMCYDGEV